MQDSPKPVSASATETTYLVLPHHTNPQGNIFGGQVMAWIDSAAACVAYRHCRRNTVTASMDHLDFYNPILLGDIVLIRAQVNYTGRTSLEIGVKVIAENPLSGVQTHTSTAYLTFVAIDAHNRPCSIPPLLISSEEEKQRWSAAEARRKYRLEKQRQGTASGGA